MVRAFQVVVVAAAVGSLMGRSTVSGALRGDTSGALRVFGDSYGPDSNRVRRLRTVTGLTGIRIGEVLDRSTGVVVFGS